MNSVPAIKSIAHIPGLGWVNSFMRWPSVFRLPAVTLFSLILLAVPALLGASVQENATLMVSLLMAGASLAVLVILARGAQADLESCHESVLVDALSPTRSQGRLEFFVACISGIGFVGYFEVAFGDGFFAWRQFLDANFYRNQTAGSVLNEVLQPVFVWQSGVIIFMAAMMSFRQIRLFTRWAGEFNIDLMHIEECQVMTLQPLRYLLILVVFASLNIIVYQILTATGFGDEVLLSLGPILGLMILFILPFLRPMVVMKQRIAEKKHVEVDAIRQALSGNRSELSRAQIATLADEFKAPDLLMYEQYVRGIWDWPIQGFVQRILLYVLLPPLAWVLAALVEQLVEAAL